MRHLHVRIGTSTNASLTIKWGSAASAGAMTGNVAGADNIGWSMAPTNLYKVHLHQLLVERTTLVSKEISISHRITSR